MVCFSPKRFGMDILKEILRGGIDKIRESGASLLGGHSVEDEEIKYGLSVTGFVHPDRIVFNEGAQPGDVLILTKPLGTGILSTGIRGQRLSPEGGERLIKTMTELNDRAAQAMLSAGARAATDVTGFGLAGHLKEMIKESIGVEIFAGKLPFFPEAPGLIEAGFMPSGLYNNRDFYVPHVIMEQSGFTGDLIFDPQSSGGLLIALAEECSDRFRESASQSSLEYWVIGRFIEEPRGKIVVR
jgi:selenide,water dikinase